MLTYTLWSSAQLSAWTKNIVRNFINLLLLRQPRRYVLLPQLCTSLKGPPLRTCCCILMGNQANYCHSLKGQSLPVLMTIRFDSSATFEADPDITDRQSTSLIELFGVNSSTSCEWESQCSWQLKHGSIAYHRLRVTTTRIYACNLCHVQCIPFSQFKYEISLWYQIVIWCGRRITRTKEGE